ncbi:MAG: response regulator transcription factor [Flavobacteriaceae bacterium]|nr:response regulator transcription factor [Flavobacteriaceae bacterium]
MSEKVTCIIVDDEPIAREILISFIEKIPSLQLVKSCKNALEAFDVINSEKIDLFFLDINMPEISGLSLAKLISKESKVIFTTAYRDYAVEGFNLKAVDYLLKPIAFDRFLEAINKYFEVNNTNHQQKKEKTEQEASFFFVRSERKMVRVDFNEVLFVESIGDYVKIFLKSKTIVTRETITNIEAKLPQTVFMRVHRSFIVAISSIESYTNEFVEVYQKAIPISRKYKESILNKLDNL